MISTCYLSETANVPEFLSSCATAVFEGKNGKTEQKTNTYVEARDRYKKRCNEPHFFWLLVVFWLRRPKSSVLFWSPKPKRNGRFFEICFGPFGNAKLKNQQKKF